MFVGSVSEGSLCFSYVDLVTFVAIEPMSPVGTIGNSPVGDRDKYFKIK